MKKPGVTLLSGFLGAGKTTLLKRIAENDLGYKIAVVVNDVAALNIDASFVRKSGRKKAFDDNAIIEMQNGCVCCTLRTDLVKAIAELATMGKYDAIVVEASGVSEPAQIGEMFQVEFDAGGFPAAEESLKNARDQNAMAQVLRAMKGAISLEEIVRLDTCITVVDCAAFNGDITTPEDLVSRFGLRDTENGERSVAALLAEQIEFADLIVLNKCDLVKRHEANVIEDAVRNLNPGAQILRTEFSNVPLNLVLNTHRFDMKKVSNNAGWLRGLRKNRVVETREYGISSFVYRSTTPFHPIRLASFLESFCGVVNLDGIDEKRVAYNENGFHDARAKFGYVLRSKGFIWLAGRDDMCGEWGHAGSNLSIGCGGPWMGALPENAWPEEGTEAREMLERDMSNAIILDRRQELVFIGQRLNKCAIEAALQKSRDPEDVLQLLLGGASTPSGATSPAPVSTSRLPSTWSTLTSPAPVCSRVSSPRTVPTKRAMPPTVSACRVRLSAPTSKSSVCTRTAITYPPVTGGKKATSSPAFTGVSRSP